MQQTSKATSETLGKCPSVDLGDFSIEHSVNMIEKKKIKFFSKLFRFNFHWTFDWKCMSDPITFDSLTTHSPCSSPEGARTSLVPSVENVFGNVIATECVADNFSFFDSKTQKD
jgi:hypothetical protein